MAVVHDSADDRLICGVLGTVRDAINALKGPDGTIEAAFILGKLDGGLCEILNDRRRKPNGGPVSLKDVEPFDSVRA